MEKRIPSPALLFLGIWIAVCAFLVSTSTSEASQKCTFPIASKDYSACDFSGIDLSGEDLRGANLNNADLTGANLQGANLRYAQLQDANLTEINLSNASLEGANLTSATLTNANMKNASLREADPVNHLFPTNLSSANLLAANLSGANFSGSVLVAADLSSADLSGADFSRGNLLSVNLSHSKLENAIFSDATLTAVRSGSIAPTSLTLPSKYKLDFGYILGPMVDLTGADLSNLTLEFLNLEGATLRNSNLSNSTLTGLNLSGSNIEGAQINQASIIDSNLQSISSGQLAGQSKSLPVGYRITLGYLIGPGVSLTQASLRGAQLQDEDLSHVDFTGADLTSSNLANSNLDHSNFRYSNLQNTTLSGASVEGANFSSSIKFGLRSGGLQGIVTGLDTWQEIQGYLVGDGADLSNSVMPGASFVGMNLSRADFSGAFLADADFTQSNLSDAIFDDATLTRANLSQTRLNGMRNKNVVGSESTLLPVPWRARGGFLVGPGVDLSEANLAGLNLSFVDLSGANFQASNFTGASLRNANLSGANLVRATISGANLDGARLEGADLSHVKSGGIVGLPSSKPEGWNLIKGYLVGATANLSGADLRGVNFSGFDIQRADFTGSNLSSADLAALDFSTSIMDDVNFASANLSFSKLPRDCLVDNSDFSNANLAHVDLSNFDLSHADFTGANFEGANVSGASLTFAELQDSTGGNLVGTPARMPSGWSIWNGAFLQLMNDLPAVVIGRPEVGKLISVDSGSWPQGVLLNYLWFIDGLAIPDSNVNRFTPKPEQANHELQFQVTATKKGFRPEVIRTHVVTIGSGSMSSTPTPNISGTFKVGSTLTASIGNWDQGTTIATQWLRDGNPINSATSNTYLVLPGDVGHQISVQTTGTATGYLTIVKTSNNSTIGSGSMSSTPTPNISGTFKVGSTLKVTTSAWALGASISFQWLLDGKVIKGATKSTYKLLTAQKGHKISVKVTQSAPGYSTASATSLATKVG